MTLKDPSINDFIPGHAGRGRGGAEPALITLHVQEGENYLPGPTGYFMQSGDDCTIYSMEDGRLVRGIYDSDSAYTNGTVIGPDMSNPIIASLVRANVSNTNRYSLTIEHQGFARNKFTDAQYESTARMVAYWCQKYGWECNRTRVVGHYQVGEHKGCPGPNFDFNRVIKIAQEIMAANTTPIPTEDPNAHEFKETNYWVVNTLPDGTPVNFYSFWRNNGGINSFGLPTSSVIIDPDTGRPGQWFESGYLEYFQENVEPFKVLRRLLGNQYKEVKAQNNVLQKALDQARLEITALGGSPLSAPEQGKN
jgi:hypothetical protein